MKLKNIVIATIKSWNLKNAQVLREQLKNIYNVVVVEKKEDLTAQYLSSIAPEYVFFPHWSWIIPSDIHRHFRCIVFHMTDVPFGRGGSPLQNLISRGMYSTKISALEVVDGLDAGGVYLKEPLDLSEGSADELFKKCSEKVFCTMIPYILQHKPTAVEQTGEIVAFKRRKPEGSNLLLAHDYSIDQLYDFIRMLDGEGYPAAFLDSGKYKIEFFNIQKEQDHLAGLFRIVLKPN